MGTKSNKVRKLKTPGSKLVIHYMDKKGKGAMCGEPGSFEIVWDPFPAPHGVQAHQQAAKERVAPIWRLALRQMCAHEDCSRFSDRGAPVGEESAECTSHHRQVITIFVCARLVPLSITDHSGNS